jgi:hypothetical protein
MSDADGAIGLLVLNRSEEMQFQLSNTRVDAWCKVGAF